VQRLAPSSTVTTAARRRPHIFYGWLIVAAGMGVQALQGALLSSSYGAYVVLLQGDYGWSKTVFSGAYALQQVESGILGPLQGWMIDRFGPRTVMRAGIVLFALGFMLFGRLDSVLTFYLTFLLIAVGTSLAGFFPISVTLVHWFARRRATAMGIMATGMGIGGLLAPLVAWSLGAHGWRATAFASGVLVLAVGLPLTALMRHKPEPYGYLPDGDPPDRAAAVTPTAGSARGQGPAPGRRRDFTAREALRTRAFWCISFGHAAALLVVSAVMVHLVPNLTQELGFTVTQGAAVVALLTAMSMVGQLTGGLLGDRFSKRWLVLGCMVGHMVALLLLAFATTVGMVVAFAVLHGLAWGIRGPLMQAIRADYFGRTSFGTIMGFSNVIVTLGTIAGPLVAGVLADRLGDYRAGFTILALLAGSGSGFWLLATKPVPPAAAPIARV
jgi:MFS family permease